jgi:hypothetical protein
MDWLGLGYIQGSLIGNSLWIISSQPSSFILVDCSYFLVVKVVSHSFLIAVNQIKHEEIEISTFLGPIELELIKKWELPISLFVLKILNH